MWKSSNDPRRDRCPGVRDLGRQALREPAPQLQDREVIRRPVVRVRLHVEPLSCGFNAQKFDG
jgi:hypothetical protein